MRNALTFTLVLLSFVCFGQIVTQNGKVIQVLDGDTFVILSEGKRIKARLAGCDAPEKLQHYGKESADSIAKTVLLKDVVFEYDKKAQFDKFGRWLVAIKVGPVYLDSLAVACGWVWYYDKYPTKISRCKLSDMQGAKAKNIGLWGCQSAIPPSLFRRLRYSDRYKFKNCFTWEISSR